MLKRSLIGFLVIAALMLAMPSYVGAQNTEITKHAEQIKQEVAALPIGTRLLVKLRDKKKLTGHINYTGEEFFVITDVKTKASQKLVYADVAQITRKEDPGFPHKGQDCPGNPGCSAGDGADSQRRRLRPEPRRISRGRRTEGHFPVAAERL